jgi:hypothetical protein
MPTEQKKPSLEVAAAVAVAAKQIGGAYVYASLSKGILREENASAVIAKNEFAEFACADCGTEFQALAALKPHCITCGTLTRKVEGKEKVQAKIHPDTELVSITCNACNTVNITHEKVLSSIGASNNPHCTSCGTELAVSVVKADDALPEDDEVTVDDLEVSTDGEDDDKEESAKDEEKKDDKEKSAEGEKKDEKKDDAEKSAESKDDEKKDDKEKSAEGEDKKDEEEKSEPHCAEEEKKDDEEKSGEHNDVSKDPREAEHLVDELPGSGDKAVADADEMMEEVDMTDMLDDENLEEMSVIARSGAVMLASGPYIFAELKVENAGENRDIFESAEFRKAIVDSLRKEGHAKTMAAFKFSPVKVKASLKKHVAKVIAKKVSEAAAALKQQQKELSANFKQSLDIAAVGLQKSFWAKRINPLKAALITELATLGMRNPERLVTRLFDQQGLAYTAALIAQAEELMAKSPEMRNEIASVLDMTQSVIASGDDDESESDEATVLSGAKELSEGDTTKLRREKSASVASVSKQSVLANVLGDDANDLF